MPRSKYHRRWRRQRREPLGGLGVKHYIKCRYAFKLTDLTLPIGGGNYNLTIAGNSPGNILPGVATAEQPYQWQFWRTVYPNYRCYASKCRVYAYYPYDIGYTSGTSLGNASAIATLAAVNASPAVINSYTSNSPWENMAIGGVRSSRLYPDPYKECKLKSYQKTKWVIADSDLDPANLLADTAGATNPSNQWFWVIQLANPTINVNGTSRFGIDVVVDYWVEFVTELVSGTNQPEAP